MILQSETSVFKFLRRSVEILRDHYSRIFRQFSSFCPKLPRIYVEFYCNANNKKSLTMKKAIADSFKINQLPTASLCFPSLAFDSDNKRTHITRTTFARGQRVDQVDAFCLTSKLSIYFYFFVLCSVCEIKFQALRKRCQRLFSVIGQVLISACPTTRFATFYSQTKQIKPSREMKQRDGSDKKKKKERDMAVARI